MQIDYNKLEKVLILCANDSCIIEAILAAFTDFYIVQFDTKKQVIQCK